MLPRNRFVSELTSSIWSGDDSMDVMKMIGISRNLNSEDIAGNDQRLP